jgi:hypothetical protein
VSLKECEDVTMELQAMRSILKRRRVHSEDGCWLKKKKL